MFINGWIEKEVVVHIHSEILPLAATQMDLDRGHQLNQVRKSKTFSI